VTGFEPLDLVQGIAMTLSQLEEGRAEAENQYARVVTRDGNEAAQLLMDETFRTVNRTWRGLGFIPGSGLRLSAAYAEFDAEDRFGVAKPADDDSAGCISGAILQGIKRPSDCTRFGTECTPEQPLGAPMVSSEGTCQAYYRYARSSVSSEVS
jgi:hydrogenase expression/formation protein HypD